MRKGKKGQLAILFAFLIIVLICIFVFAVAAPLGTAFITKTYTSGQGMMNLSYAAAQDIDDPELKAALLDTMGSAKNATQDNIDILSALYKYGWVFVIVALGFTLFLLTRKVVETSGGIV